MKQAIQSQSVSLGIESAIELQRRGSLAPLVQQRLDQLKQDENANVAAAATGGSEILNSPTFQIETLTELLDKLVIQLNASNDEARQ